MHSDTLQDFRWQWLTDMSSKYQSRLLILYMCYSETFPLLLQPATPLSLPGSKAAEPSLLTSYIKEISVDLELPLLCARTTFCRLSKGTAHTICNESTAIESTSILPFSRAS